MAVVEGPCLTSNSMQESSHSESMSTLAFGGRVSEIALGAAKKNVESGAVFEAREAARGLDAAVGSERQARKGAESRAAAAEKALASARSDLERLQVGACALPSHLCCTSAVRLLPE